VLNKPPTVQNACLDLVEYKEMVENMVDLVCRFNPDTILTFVNDAYCLYFAKKRNDILGTSFLPLIPIEEHENIKQQINSLSVENPVMLYENPVKGANNEVHWYHWIYKANFNENAQLIDVLCVGRDITQCKQAEAALISAHDELKLEAQQRTEELSRANEELTREINERVKVQENLEYKLHFEGLLLNISEDFYNAEADDIDSNISHTLQIIGEFTHIDRSYVFLFSPDGEKMDNTHEWCREGIQPEIENLQDLPVDIFPWWMKKLRKRETIYISDLNELPLEAQAEKEILEPQQIKSLLVVPISYKNELFGYLGFDSVKQCKEWSADNIILLKMVADSIANAIARKRTYQTLQESEGYYRAIFENKGLAMAIIDENMTINMINGECARLFNYSAEEVQGENVFKFIHPDYFNKLEQYQRIRNYKDLAAPVKYDARLMSKQGKYVNVLMGVDLIPGTGNRIVSLSDITQLKRDNHAHKILSASNMALMHAVDEKSFLQTICQIIVETGGYSFAWVGKLEEKGSINPVGYAGSNAGYIQSLKISRAIVKYDECIVMKAIKTRKYAVCENSALECSINKCQQNVIRNGHKSGIAFPLLLKGDDNPLGILHILASEDNIFDKQEVALLRELAEDLAFGIISLRIRFERDKALEELKQSLNKQRRALNQTVGALARAMENRDPYTAGHQRRVADLACAIAREMGLSKDRIEGIAVAGALHDIGKFNIPIEILNRPGRLSKIEFDLIKNHSQLGYDILKDIEFPEPVAEMVLQHHEKLDGSGYPLGLTDKDILLEAKIIAVADAVEAMASHRPYRPALGLDAGLDEIYNKKGVLFDPEVVDICIKLFKEKDYIMQ